MRAPSAFVRPARCASPPASERDVSEADGIEITKTRAELFDDHACLSVFACECARGLECGRHGHRVPLGEILLRDAIRERSRVEARAAALQAWRVFAEAREEDAHVHL